jgi:hypothetical protein
VFVQVASGVGWAHAVPENAAGGVVQADDYRVGGI